MRRPGQLADRVVVAGEQNLGGSRGLAQVEGADQAVDAGGGEDGAAVFVPVVGEGFVRGGGWLRCARVGGVEVEGLGGGVDGDLELEVVAGAGGGAEVPQAELRVAGDGGEDAG